MDNAAMPAMPVVGEIRSDVFILPAGKAFAVFPCLAESFSSGEGVAVCSTGTATMLFAVLSKGNIMLWFTGPQQLDEVGRELQDAAKKHVEKYGNGGLYASPAN